MTRAPSAANPTDMAFPIPFAAPVTRATFPSNFINSDPSELRHNSSYSRSRQRGFCRWHEILLLHNPPHTARGPMFLSHLYAKARFHPTLSPLNSPMPRVRSMCAPARAASSNRLLKNSLQARLYTAPCAARLCYPHSIAPRSVLRRVFQQPAERVGTICIRRHGTECGRVRQFGHPSWL